MKSWIFSVIDRLGAVGVGLLILLENVVPPIPSEVILPLAGFRSRTGSLNVATVWPAATLGAVLGALLLYALGAALGYERLHRLSGHRWFFVASTNDLDRGRELFDRHGGKIVLLGRCVPVVRSLVSIPAGISKMPLGRFILLTAIGSGVWNAIFIALGWLLGEHSARVQNWVRPASYVVIGLCAVALVVVALRRKRSLRPTG